MILSRDTNNKYIYNIKMSKNSKREFEHYVFSLDKNNNCIFTIFNKNKNIPTGSKQITLIRSNKTSAPYAFNTFIGKIPFDFTLKGKEYHKGDLIEYNYATGSSTVIKNPQTDNPHNTVFANPLQGVLYANTLDQYNKLTKGSKSIIDLDSFKWTNLEPFKKSKSIEKSSEKSWLMQIPSDSRDRIKQVLSNSDSSNDSSNSGSLNSSDSSSAPITDTDSTTSTRSFDFLDDILGTQKEQSKDKTTELNPNQIANTIVNETKLNDTAISSLVSTYLNSLYRINRSYNTQTK